MKKILLVSHYSIFSNRGVEKSLKEIYSVLAKKYEITVCFQTNHQAQKEIQRYRNEGLRSKAFYIPKLFGLEFYIYMFVSNIWILINLDKFKLVIGNNNSLFFVLLFKFLIKSNTKFINIFHNVKQSYYEAINLKRWWEPILIFTDIVSAKADIIIAVSEGVRLDLVRYYGIDSSKVTVIYNAIPAAKQIGQVSKKDKKVLLFVSNDNIRKGINIINEISQLFAHRKDIQIVIVGPDMTGVKDYENIKYIGSVPNNIMNKVYNSAYLLLLPSYNEGHPLVALEALSYGVPIICSKHSNVEIIDNTRAGFVISSFKAIDYKKMIDKYLNDHDFYLRGRQDAIKIAKRYTIKSQAELVNNVITNALS